MPHIETLSTDIFRQRREALVEHLKKHYPQASSGIILLFSNFERECAVFKQEPSFFYLTGIEEPATALVIDLACNKTTLFIPNFGSEREKWMASPLNVNKGFEQQLGVDEITYLGEPCTGYQCHPFFTDTEYAHLVHFLQRCVLEKQPIFTLSPHNKHAYIEQRFILQRIATMIPGFRDVIIDISPVIEEMRRKKTNPELELLYKAVDITMQAQEMVAKEIKEGIVEYELEGLINYIFVGKGGGVAFPSIVASGINSTVLHYHHNNKTLKNGDLVVVDIGAEYNHYCADLTRTYPVSGKFSKRQREIYTLVLETQEYVAECAKPGMWISNKEQPATSLHHLALKYLADKGYDKYFIHGIGHYLGLDVHDVGDYKKPLEPGDVFTIEPGIYMPAEEIGVRIEDNYWVVEDGVICLSQDLPKHPDDIEKMMHN